MTAATVPVHLGIIPDGNRRWAKERGKSTLEGHNRGFAVAKEIAIASFDRGVEYFTIYAFSNENWNRTQAEIGYLMDLIYGFLKREFAELEKRGVRFRFMGRRDELSSKLLKIIDDTEMRTAEHVRGTISLCLNYGGQMELVDAFKRMIDDGVRADDVTADLIAEKLYQPEVPPVDLIIRTSGEQRISGFMLWRSAYAEFYFVDKFWPEFTVTDLDFALADFADRQRRYGK